MIQSQNQQFNTMKWWSLTRTVNSKPTTRRKKLRFRFLPQPQSKRICLIFSLHQNRRLMQMRRGVPLQKKVKAQTIVRSVQVEKISDWTSNPSFPLHLTTSRKNQENSFKWATWYKCISNPLISKKRWCSSITSKSSPSETIYTWWNMRTTKWPSWPQVNSPNGTPINWWCSWRGN